VRSAVNFGIGVGHDRSGYLICGHRASTASYDCNSVRLIGTRQPHLTRQLVYAADEGRGGGSCTVSRAQAALISGAFARLLTKPCAHNCHHWRHVSDCAFEYHVRDAIGRSRDVQCANLVGSARPRRRPRVRPLGGIRKRASFGITLRHILLVTPDLIRLLMRKSVGSNGNPWQPPGRAPVLHSDYVGALLWASPVPAV
jgi:hypothetical protein